MAGKKRLRVGNIKGGTDCGGEKVDGWEGGREREKVDGLEEGSEREKVDECGREGVRERRWMGGNESWTVEVRDGLKKQGKG